MPAILLFWTLMNFFQGTSGYAVTFVAQYHGAGRPRRVGPAVGQGLIFGLIGGLFFIALAPFGQSILELAGHDDHLLELEATYFRCLCYSGLPGLITASANGFFSGRGDSRTVLGITSVGLVVNAVLDYLLIFGQFGFPKLGIAGAGWATVCGNWASAVVALALVLRPNSVTNLRPTAFGYSSPELFCRLMYYGVPNGLMLGLDCLGFTLFGFLVGRFGEVELAATSATITLNMIIILPILGVGQAVEVLVGQRLGDDRPDLAERTHLDGVAIAGPVMLGLAVLLLIEPRPLIALFVNRDDPRAAALAAMVQTLLYFVAAYTVFDTVNLVVSFALRGAGDTRFVTVVAVVASWLVMVLPTYAAVAYDWGIYWTWSFASAYIGVQAGIFLFRFLHGAWKEMRVIEAVEPDSSLKSIPRSGDNRVAPENLVP